MKSIRSDESVISVNTQFSLNLNPMSEQTLGISAYGIRIAEALEVIELDEKAKNEFSVNSNTVASSIESLLGKRKQPEPYNSSQQSSNLSQPSLLDFIRN